jgi:hypothetical protein
VDVAGNTCTQASGIAGYSTSFSQYKDDVPDGVLNVIGSEVRYADLANGTYYLHAQAVDQAGNKGPVEEYGIKVDFTGELLSEAFVKAVPNPVRTDTAHIEYELAARTTDVRLEFINSKGDQVHSVSGTRQVGKNYYEWNVSGLANGVYFLKITAKALDDGKTHTAIKKVAVLR